MAEKRDFHTLYPPSPWVTFCMRCAVGSYSTTATLLGCTLKWHPAPLQPTRSCTRAPPSFIRQDSFPSPELPLPFPSALLACHLSCSTLHQQCYYRSAHCDPWALNCPSATKPYCCCQSDSSPTPFSPPAPPPPPCSYNLTAAPAVSGWSQHPLPLPPAATSLGGSLLTVHHDEASGHTLVTSQGVQASLLLEGCLSGMGAWRVCAIDAVLWRPPPPPPPPPALDSVATTPATATVQEAV